jgi:hypothetical protein
VKDAAGRATISPLRVCVSECMYATCVCVCVCVRVYVCSVRV